MANWDWRYLRDLVHGLYEAVSLLPGVLCHCFVPAWHIVGSFNVGVTHDPLALVPAASQHLA